MGIDVLVSAGLPLSRFGLVALLRELVGSGVALNQVRRTGDSFPPRGG